jgi:uncharacterized protein YyaL (SSP411 family)
MHTNSLIEEKSPYLQQHAHNPVNWYAWGEEAFRKARDEDKPIFLSVGYSTCHWCHVMERESFENEELAEVLNRYFVPVKVDREERPDVDRIYMTFVQATTGSGGWPMSVWLTPDLKPFFGGTYFPPDNRYGRPGFKSVLEYLANLWATERARILDSSEHVTRQLDEQSRLEPRTVAADAGVLDSAYYQFRRMFDSRLGGFGGAPKFPRPAVHNFLLRYYKRTGNEEALEMVLKTLDEMARGGMRDQIGGGFHRYSVDDRWFVPHFEKMLYDQAQLAVSYIEAFQITHNDFYAGMARDILDYVLRDMTDAGGAFYSAEDADSVIDPAQPGVKGEGAFYTWSRQELESALDPATLEWFCYRYGVEPGGNVREDPHGEFTGKNILYQAHTIEETAQRFRVSAAEVSQALGRARAGLLDVRSRRIRPHLDDKILTAWNGLMISAFAKAAQALSEHRYADAARRAAGFILGSMYGRETGVLLRRFRDGEAAISGFLDDYAFFAEALIDVFEIDGEASYLEDALRLGRTIRDLFEDSENGGFYSTAGSDASLILRMKDDYDGAEPSGNSIAALALFRLSRLTHDEALRKSADRTLQALSQRLSAAPSAVPQLLVAYLYSTAPPRQVVVAGPADNGLLRYARSRFLPEWEVLPARPEAAILMPELAEMGPVNGKPAAYVCENFACQLPVTEVDRLSELLT